MKKNKKLLSAFLALNAILSAYISGASVPTPKYDRLYNNIKKNTELGKSNEKNYQTVERILKQKNKELKDLYLQGDYIVKPEYLEWQIFFTGFYEEYNEGVDNSKENARYHSKVTGYFDTDGNYISTSGIMGGLEGKPYKPLQQPKEINLGVSIPIKGMSRDPLNLVLTPIGDININPSTQNISPPTFSINPTIVTNTFNIENPVIKIPITFVPDSFSVKPPSTGNADESFTALQSTDIGANGSRYRGYTAMISQYNISSGYMKAVYDGYGYTNYTRTGGLSSYEVSGLNATRDYRIGFGGIYGSTPTTITNLTVFGTPDDRNAVLGASRDVTALFKTVAAEKIELGTSGIKSSLVMEIESNLMNPLVGADTFPHLIQYDPHDAQNPRNYKPYPKDHYGNTVTESSGAGAVTRFGELINHGTLKGKGNSLLLVGMQSHGGNQSAVYRNKGLMVGEYDASYTSTNGGERHIAHAFIAWQDSSPMDRRWEFYNESGGRIELQAKQSVAYFYGQVDKLVNRPHYNIYNDGEIVLYGVQNVGIRTAAATSNGDLGELTYSKIVLNKAIEVNGDQSIGVEIAKLMDDGYDTADNPNYTPNTYDEQTAVIKVLVGSDENKHSGNATGLNPSTTLAYDQGYVENSVGLLINKDSLFYRLKEFDFQFGDYAKNSTLVDVLKGHLYLDNSMVQSIDIKNGVDNFGLFASGVNSKLTLAPDITVGTLSVPVNGTIALSADDGAEINLAHSNSIKTYGEKSHALVLKDSGTSLRNTTAGLNHSFEVSGDGSIGLYVNKADLDLSDSQEINVSAKGEKSVGVYNEDGRVKIGLSGTGTGTYEADGLNSVLFYNKTLNAVNSIETSGTIFNVKNGGLFSYIEADLTSPQIKFTNSGGTTLNLSDGARGFIYTGNNISVNAIDLQTYFNNNYSGLGNMTVNLSTNASLFVIQKFGNISLNDVNIVASGTGIFPNIVNSGGKNAFLTKGILILNPASNIVDLDSTSELYTNIDKALLGVTVNGTVTVKGTKDNQVALADDNSYEAVQYVKMTNNGTIDLIGGNSVGIYANRGQIKNNGMIQVLGDKNIGIFSENGTDTENSTNINVGNGGVGIYAVSHQNPSVPPSIIEAQTIKVKNSGVITAITGSNAIGIYAKNNKSGGVFGDAQIDLANGKIELGASKNAIGVFVDNGEIHENGSTITVGENGIGIYAKDSDLNLNNLIINLNGDNSLGLYLDGNTNLNTGIGTINIAGQNVVLFNINSTGTTINNNFTVGTVASGSSYTLGNIINGTFDYTGSSVLSSNGVLVSGQSSSVFLNGSTITVNPGSTGVAAIALDGQGTPSAGMTPNTDGENTGTVTLENASVGLYGKNGARLKNSAPGIITTGDQSAGIMTSGAGSTAVNTGIINIGTGSQGMTLKDGVDIVNDAGGSILSSGIGSVGIYADNVTGLIENNGTIQLLGNKAIGIYTKGTNIKTINNNGIIEVGVSGNINDPSIGIFSENPGDIITNTNTIKSGVNSIGIYSSGGTVNQNGVSDIGDTGVGVYSVNGTVNIGGTSVFNFGANNAVGVYGINSSVTNNAAMNIGSGNYGFILTNGTFTSGAGNINLGSDSVYVYRSGLGTITNGSAVTMSGSDNIGFYIVDGGEIVNNAAITGTAGNNNVGIYNAGGKIDNAGTIAVGASDLGILTNPVDGTISVDVQNSKYAVGIYGENSVITNQGSGNISIGYGSIGIVAKKGSAVNDGSITGTGDRMMGMYSEGAVMTNNGSITLTGDNVIGMAGNGKGSILINKGTINVSGENAIGMYGNLATEITNSGTITANGLGAQGIVLSQGSSLDNTVTGTMIVNSITTGNYESSVGTVYPTPSIINSGVIKVSEKFETDGINVVIKVDPSTVTVPTTSEIASGGYDPVANGADYLISNATSIEAPSFNITNPLQITGNFAEGTNVKKYKLEDVIIPGSGNGIDTGKVPVVSKSLTWKATPVVNNSGNIDIWMEKIDYDEFTDGLWYEDFGRALDDKYFNAQGEALEIFDKIDVIETETEFRHVMASLAGNVYANINQREYDVAKVLEDSLHLLQNSTNNTKENVKISVIAGKGKNKEETDGVVGYDYTTTGVLALREVERTYKHTFGYSLGYAHTGFEFKDGNESEEWVDTIQLGVHNKYKSDGWTLRNDLTGRASIHNVDRNIDWPSPNSRSEMNGSYETYSITSDNILGKEFKFGKESSIMPYGAFRAMYVTRPDFSESGLESLEVEGNDAWSAKPRAGVELKGAVPLGANTAWKLKGLLDIAYEYELADLNEREKARLVAIEDGYHKLSKPEDEKGTFRTKASLGVEVEDRYGIFLTGEYSTGNDKEDDYRAGVTLKAVF